MHRISLLILILFLLHSKCFSSVDTTHLPIEIGIRVNKEFFVNHEKSYYNYHYKNQKFFIQGDSAKEKHYDVEVSIKNTSTQPIYIWLMTCSWYDNFTFSNEYVFFDIWGCDKNCPALVNLQPLEIKEYKATFIRNIKYDYPPKNAKNWSQVVKTKLGLITINNIYKENFKVDYYDCMKDKNNWTITWSKPLYFR